MTVEIIFLMSWDGSSRRRKNNIVFQIPRIPDLCSPLKFSGLSKYPADGFSDNPDNHNGEGTGDNFQVICENLLRNLHQIFGICCESDRSTRGLTTADESPGLWSQKNASNELLKARIVEAAAPGGGPPSL